ncbi:MAG: 3-isopropylmalate dehydratase small subunit [Verrucomicrobiota bacterium]
MALEKITHVQGKGVHVPGHDIDTDRIIPARFMKCVTFDGLGEYAFYDVRFEEDGAEKDHPLNDERFSEASILLTGSNFGCGSSREHAPQALYRYGSRAIIAESFADIFFGNCTTLGVLCATAAGDDIQKAAAMIEEDHHIHLVIDVEGQHASCGEFKFDLNIPESARTALAYGRWDPIGELLEGADDVAETAGALSYMHAPA